MTKPWIGLVLAIVALMVACYFFLPRGYGPVSNEAYQFAKALYGAALEHSEEKRKPSSALSLGHVSI